ncbi:PH domain-containing protein [Saxibacter everestensis]|uniref:PH domain-containing protein n=1 Tax=Saxibacter everestensis TaxID=2909229 RepID=A0ABY8QRI2_9MICO|nr:PH domain-containing protein [Brevibacteriaceae bacterium ZFBP1038]
MNQQHPNPPGADALPGNTGGSGDAVVQAGGPDDAAAQPGGPDDAAAQPGGPGEPAWRKVHKATPFVRGWLILVAIVGISIRQLLESGGNGGASGLRWIQESGYAWLPFALAGGVLLCVLIIVAFMYLSWRFTRYRVLPEAVIVERGIFFRQHRQARLDRVQAIDVVQPLVARILGLAQLKFNVAGGSEASIDLSFLTLKDAQRLRAALLAGAAGIEVAAGEDAPEAPEAHLLAIGPGKILGSLLLTFWGLVVPLAVAALIVLAIVFGRPEILTAAIPGILGGIAALWKRFATESNFRIADSPDGIRVHSGLLETTAHTVPPGRIQAVGIYQPLLWRIPGWWRISVNIAATGDSSESAKNAMLPVGNRSDLLSVLALVLPEPGVTDPLGLVDAALTGRRADGGFEAVPRRARWVDPFAWKRQAFCVTETAVVVRRGWINRIVDFVPHARTQSIRLSQGPLQRRLGLASVALHTTAGPVSPQIPHLARPEAVRFLQQQSIRGHRARKTLGPELWMRKAGEAGRSGAGSSAEAAESLEAPVAPAATARPPQPPDQPPAPVQ